MLSPNFCFTAFSDRQTNKNIQNHTYIWASWDYKHEWQHNLEQVWDTIDKMKEYDDES